MHTPVEAPKLSKATDHTAEDAAACTTERIEQTHFDAGMTGKADQCGIGAYRMKIVNQHADAHTALSRSDKMPGDDAHRFSVMDDVVLQIEAALRILDKRNAMLERSMSGTHQPKPRFAKGPRGNRH